MNILFFIITLFLSTLAYAGNASLTIQSAVNIFGNDYELVKTTTNQYTWLFNINNLTTIYPPPTPHGASNQIPYVDMKIESCYLTIETDNDVIVNTVLNGGGCLEFKLNEKYLRFKALLYPSDLTNQSNNEKTHNNQLSSD